MALVTAESVAAACEAIVTEGERPTVARVTETLGGGSPNKILPLLNAWKDAQRQGAQPAPAPPSQADAGGDIVTPEMGNAVETIARNLLSTMTGFIERERDRAQAAQQAI